MPPGSQGGSAQRLCPLSKEHAAFHLPARRPGRAASRCGAGGRGPGPRTPILGRGRPPDLTSGWVPDLGRGWNPGAWRELPSHGHGAVQAEANFKEPERPCSDSPPLRGKAQPPQPRGGPLFVFLREALQTTNKPRDTASAQWSAQCLGACCSPRPMCPERGGPAGCPHYPGQQAPSALLSPGAAPPVPAVEQSLSLELALKVPLCQEALPD